MLNLLYPLLESEARLAAAALWLDPGLGLIHVDTPARASLACDLMEAVRPKVWKRCAYTDLGGNYFDRLNVEGFEAILGQAFGETW